MKPLHAWNVGLQEAINIQQNLRKAVKITPFKADIQYIAGADISFNRDSNAFYAGFVILAYSNLQEVAHVTVKIQATFPYVPGLLSFREIPPLLEAWYQLPVQPDVIILDGHGIAHPRRLGIASHFGLWVDKPTIGCAKKLLTGMYGNLPAEAKEQTTIYDKHEAIGIALRTKRNVKPVFVSPGHLTDLQTAADIVAGSVTKYRLPEPTRKAHWLVNQVRKGELPVGVKMH